MFVCANGTSREPVALTVELTVVRACARGSLSYGARQLHALVPFLFALGRNVAFLLADLRTPPHPVHGEYHWQYTDRASCPNQGFGCYFKETTACPRHEARASRQTLFKLHSVPERVVAKVRGESCLLFARARHLLRCRSDDVDLLLPGVRPLITRPLFK